jgi:hypothetical protein
MLLLSGYGLAVPSGKSAAKITGSFADSCRDFFARSSKDISYVEIHYADGRVVKDERTSHRNYWKNERKTERTHRKVEHGTERTYRIDGGAGEEIAFTVVKSGTTRKHFTCSPVNDPPTANLEINGPCGLLADGTLSCDIDQPRSAWTWSRPGNGLVFWGCNSDQFCLGRPTDPAFRGTASTDPENDIVTWTIDFGDGTSAGGSWATEPPVDLVHAYPPFPDAFALQPVVTLTVTDAAGQSDSDTLRLEFTGPD